MKYSKPCSLSKHCLPLLPTLLPLPPPSLTHPASQFSLLFAFLHPLSHSPSSRFRLIPSFRVYPFSILSHFGCGGVCGLLSVMSLLCWQGGLVIFCSLSWSCFGSYYRTHSSSSSSKKHKICFSLKHTTDIFACALVGT